MWQPPQQLCFYWAFFDCSVVVLRIPGTGGSLIAFLLALLLSKTWALLAAALSAWGAAWLLAYEPFTYLLSSSSYFESSSSEDFSSTVAIGYYCNYFTSSFYCLYRSSISSSCLSVPARSGCAPSYIFVVIIRRVVCPYVVWFWSWNSADSWTECNSVGVRCCCVFFSILLLSNDYWLCCAELVVLDWNWKGCLCTMYSSKFEVTTVSFLLRSKGDFTSLTD